MARFGAIPRSLETCFSQQQAWSESPYAVRKAKVLWAMPYVFPSHSSR